MKKILSILLAAAMLVATFVVLAVPTSAATGAWSVYTAKSQHLDENTPIKRDIPGYHYTGEGLEIIPGEWVGSSPFVTIQTTEKVNISDGVYIKVRVDEFSYEANDKWFSFHVWDSQNIEPGMMGDEHGRGVETLVRMYGTDDAPEGCKPGQMEHFEWFQDTGEYRVRTNQTPEDQALYEPTFENDKPIYTFEIRWDTKNEQCEAYINGSPAPDEYNSAMNAYFKKSDYYAHVGFSLFNNINGGKGKCTILEYGFDAESAVAPGGDDSREPEIFNNTFDDVSDAKTVPANQPAVKLNGATVSYYYSYQANPIKVNDDDSINIKCNERGNASIHLFADRETNYNIEDFPIIMIITRGYCVCPKVDLDSDGKDDGICECVNEKFVALPLAGDTVYVDTSFHTETNPLTVDETFVGEDGEEYLYFILDTTNHVENEEKPLSGRIHGLRFDTTDLMQAHLSNKNNFNICEVSYFRNVGEAEIYFQEFLKTAGTTTPDDGNDDNTNPPEDVTTGTSETVSTEATEAPTVEATEGSEEITTEATEAPTAEKTEAPTEDETEAPTEGKTEAPTETPSLNVNVNAGCTSAVGVGAIAVIAIAAAGLASFRKKED